MKRLALLCSLALLTALTGCATTSPQFTANDCATVDWKQIGIQDGANGHNAQRILTHQKTCPNAAAHRATWEEGRQIGLKNYCTKSNAYELGRRGYELTGVCEANLEELHNANMMGLEQYAISHRIHRPFYGYPYGYAPFFSPWYWY